MKKNQALMAIALLSLALAVLSSTLVWGGITFPVKIGMYAFGFGTGVAAGVLVAKRRNLFND